MQPAAESFLPFDHWAYSLLLGFYLGDGCVTSTGTSYQLRVILDGLYPDVIEDCVTLQDDAAEWADRRVRLSALLLLQPVRRHPRPVLRVLRAGIRWTQSNPRNISVSHRPSVELLDSFMGPKR